MKEKLGRNTKIIILVVCIMLTIIGVAYSFIAPLISGVETESTISFNSGMIKITYQGSNVITGENIIPGWSETKEFTVVGSNNTSITQEDIMDYQIKLVVEENTFTDGTIRFELTGSSSNELDTLSPLFGKVPTGTGETLLGTARFNQDESIKNNVTHTYSLKIGFPNRNSVNQNEDMNKSFSGYVVVEEGSLQEQENEVMLLSDYIYKEYNLSYNSLSTLEEDDFGNIRYVGDTPNNYITFNDETWRIIGIEDGGVKIIRQDRIIDAEGNNTFQWNTTEINNWRTSSLQIYLNEIYYDGLTATAKKQIETTIWKIGAIDILYTYDYIYLYIQERGTNVYSGRPTEWTGNISLAYPSDWLYVSSNSSQNKKWIYNSQTESKIDIEHYEEWLLTSYQKTTYGVWYIDHYGVVRSERHVKSNSISVRPTLYLKSNIQITSGDGSKDNPFSIQLIND